MSISSRSRSLRRHATEAPARRGVSLDRGVDGGRSGFFPAASTNGPLGQDGHPFADAQTLRDLDLFSREPDDPSLFALLDRTRTAGGRKALAQLLASGRIEFQTIVRRQEAIRFFVDPAVRQLWSLRSSDRALSHIERYLDSYVPPLTGMRGPMYWIRALWYKASYAKYFEYLDSCLRTLHRFVRGLHEARGGQEGDLPDEISGCREAFDQLLGDETVSAFLRAGGTLSRFRPARMLHFDERFRRELDPLVRRCLEAVHQIDLFLALGQATEDLRLVFPTSIRGAGSGEAGPGIVCTGLFHPFLSEPVPNDLELNSEQGFLFLTGPNMAGKTTLMKAFGLAVYMAHLGLPVPCREMCLGLLDGLVSSLNVEDNLGRGHSFFYAEVRRVKDVAEQLHQGRHLLVLFDELFKGTNLRDALDGSRLVIRGFRGFPGSFFVLSSHLLELGEELEEDDSRPVSPAGKGDDAGLARSSGAGTDGGTKPLLPIRFLRFDADVDGGRPRFSYILESGVSRERLGMLILCNEGIPDLLGLWSEDLLHIPFTSQ